LIKKWNNYVGYLRGFTTGDSQCYRNTRLPHSMRFGHDWLTVKDGKKAKPGVKSLQGMVNKGFCLLVGVVSPLFEIIPIVNLKIKQ
jgi:hypothetical protein